MKGNWILLLLVFAAIQATANKTRIVADSSILGRWDITIDMNGKPAPSWLEVRHSGIKYLIGHYVGVNGSARPISKVNFDNGKLSFAIQPQWEEGSDLQVEGTLSGDKLSGTVVFPDGKKYNWTAQRAPSLRRTSTPTWGEPIKLFNGVDLKGWHATGENQWKAVNGVLTNPKSGSNLVTNDKFMDFKLHIEFRCPKGSNSGVYLRGRYEVQITDSKGKEPDSGEMGGVYGFIKPSENAALDASEWQTYDITLIGRLVTVVANGKTIICNQEIPGITGGALDSNEGQPGPLQLQGDHGAIEYRNIILTPAR